MRKTETLQLASGGAFIEGLVIDPKSCDDIPALLPGLQHLHADPVLRRRLSALPESEACPGVHRDTGRTGGRVGAPGGRKKAWRAVARAL